MFRHASDAKLISGRTLVLGLLLAIVAVSPAEGRSESTRPTDFTLTLLHCNDAESQLINLGGELTEFGGAARFATLMQDLRDQAASPSPLPEDEGVIVLTSGDNYLAGPEFNASLEKGQPYYDTMLYDYLEFDVMAIGNHEFDFGPDVFADFIDGFRLGDAESVRRYNYPTFVSANLGFENEPRLQEMVEEGRIQKSTVIEAGGELIGIVGATTPSLPFISSPRFVEVMDDVVGLVQAEIDELEAMGVNKIIFISHLQAVQEDLAIVSQLHGVDIAVAGGGDEVLANPEDLLIPGDEPYGSYPLWVECASGYEVPIVTTGGGLAYIGRLVAEFDESGLLVEIDTELSGPQRVAGGNEPDAVEPDPYVQARVVDPVVAYLEDLASNVIGTSEVALDGVREHVRTMETNQGNLIADALFWQAAELAGGFGVPEPTIALQNGGGIRNDNVIPAGDITELVTFDMCPFSNFVTIVPDIPAQQFKEILENAVSLVEFTNGRFAQVSGFSFVYDPTGTAQQLDDEGNVIVEGTRVRDVVLGDSTLIVADGAVVPGAPNLHIATINFLAAGGDQYPFRGAEYYQVGVTYQQAVANYITDGLGGLITAADYPEGGEGRIVADTGDLFLAGTIDRSQASGALHLRAAYSTTEGYSLRYHLQQASHVVVTLHDLTGRTLARLEDGFQSAGTHEISLDHGSLNRSLTGRPLTQGIYFGRIRTQDAKDATKIILTR